MEKINNNLDAQIAEKDTKEGTEEKEEKKGNDEVNLNEYINELKTQNILEHQLATTLENKESRMNRCTYNDWPVKFDQNTILALKDFDKKVCKDKINKESLNRGNQGYIYQQIFSCRTCYEEQAKWKLKQVAKEV